MDAEKHTDGSGFIVDQSSHAATFVNNIAFRNGGSCLRLTLSKNTTFVNNTCYHDAQDTADDGPPNPGELYFTQESTNSTITGVNFKNNVLVATGTGPGAAPGVYNQPTSGWANNVLKTGSVTYFTGSDGANADFTLASGATDLIGKGGTGTGVPTTDAGFDPKCVTKKAITPIGMMATGSWWQYSIDIDYIKSLGGVAKCFNPKARSGTPDIGAYANGAVTKTTAACVPTVRPPTPTGSGGMGAGGAGTGGTTTAAGGVAGTGGSSTAGIGAVIGGMSSVGGATGSGAAAATAGTPSLGSGGVPSGTAGGAPTGTGGATSTGTGGSAHAGAAATAGGSTSTGNTGNGSSGTSGDDKASSGCGCRVAGDSSRSASLAGLGLAGLALLVFRRRRQAR